MGLTNYVLMPGTDYQALCNAIRAKTGKTEALKSGELATEVESITGGGEVQTTEFLASTTFTNEYFEDFGAFGIMLEIDEATYNAWNSNTKPVIVQYDGEKYVLDPQRIDPFGTGETGVGVGNLTAFGGVGNDEPFAIAAIWDEYNGVRSYALLCGSMVDMTPTQHTIRIYQEASGSMEGVYTVTFMTEDGSAVLYERLVVDGDDCANVVDRGLLVAPTKASTAQYNYTYSGWSLTSGGSANASALKSVTADRTVYAAFESEVREYTITYLDSDGSVLKTESLAYGSTPNYIPEKNGASFTGWTPALATVTGNASYTAAWQEQITFAGGSWDDIAAISESGQAAEYFSVGDTRDIAFGDETITIAIAGFNHDDLADGSGKAGMSIVCMTVPNIKNKWTANQSSSYRHLYDKSEVHSLLNSTWKNKLPAELSAKIKAVTKTFCSSKNKDTTGTKTVSCDLWALSAAELGAINTSGYFVATGSTYALFPVVNSDTTYLQNLPTVKVANMSYNAHYWMRQLFRNGSGCVCYAKEDGGYNTVVDTKLYDTSDNYAHYIRFGFCI